jgi:exopolyphosphatase/guanosine-5'-triphosphate,3'-diphosphate pyrophosphatase
MSNRLVAILDIGSNSIKILVAERESNGGVRSVFAQTLDVRISAGISHVHSRLTQESMAAGLQAIRELLNAAAPYSPQRTIIVATSAVRDAQNGRDFRDQVRAATGYEITILSGEEEAELIGRGLLCDPGLGALANFYVFDLGGGSLECLTFQDRRVHQGMSLRLGCVRLTEKFIEDPTLPIRTEALTAIAEHVRTTLAVAPFLFSLAPDAVAIGTGGTLTTARAVLGAKLGLGFEATNPRIEVAQMRLLLDELAGLPLLARKAVPKLPPGRADVFPAALATLIAVAETGAISAYRHSLYNLRFGLAAEELKKS